MKFPPPGWNSKGKGKDEGERKEVKWMGRKSVRWGGKVSVAWPDPGSELGIRERSPVCMCPGFVSGMVLAQPQ